MCCASKLLLEDILPWRMGFSTGHVVFRLQGAIGLLLNHKVTEDAAEIRWRSLWNMDVTLGCDHVFNEIPRLSREAHHRKGWLIVPSNVLLVHVSNSACSIPDEEVPYASISTDVVACDEHRQLAYEAAIESVVLLKNKNNILPIKPSTKKIFVAGPTTTSMEVCFGNYYGFNDQMVTLLEGLAGRIPGRHGHRYTSGAMLKHPSEIRTDMGARHGASGGFRNRLRWLFIVSRRRGEEGESLLSPQNGDRESISLPASRWITSRNLRYMA